MKMNRAVLGLVGAVAVLGLLRCGPAKVDPCAKAACPAGTSCDSVTGKCLSSGGGGGGGGGGAGQCPTACVGSTPVCDPVALVCTVCTADHGCGGSTPFCDLGTPDHRCIQCRTTFDCTGSDTCNPATKKCEAPDAGPLDGGGDDGGGGGGGGAGGGAGGGGGGGGGGAGGGAGGGGGGSGLDGGCIHPDGGGVAVPCTTECDRGFTCLNGSCVLRGGTGDVQVTLRWDQPEDLDLHVVEPLPDAGECEIYYSDTNNPPGTSSCDAVGSLDLDSNAGCGIDNVDIENVIYPPGRPPSGTYTVRVDYYSNCSATGPVPYEVEVRANGTILGYCGSFLPTDADNGSAGSGVQVMTFVVP